MKTDNVHPTLQKIQELPKAELHMHLEGSLEPEMLFALAKRNKIQLPYQTVSDIHKAYRFSHLQAFLDLYYQGMSVLLQEQDYYELAQGYLKKAHQDHVQHVELFLDPQAHLSRGVSLSSVFKGIDQAIQQAQQAYGMTVSIIVCFLRHLSQKEALEAFEQLMPYRDQFIGIGLDSSELGHPPRQFKELFALARTEKLRLVAHAGEEGPASYVWEALDILGVERIDHGNAIHTDPVLIQRIVKDQIPLTMCPLSNKALNVVPDLKNHPARDLMNQGVKVTINSDDPAYFGGYLNQNYWALAKALALTHAELETLARHSIEARFDAR